MTSRTDRIIAVVRTGTDCPKQVARALAIGYWTAWRAMVALEAAGRLRRLGRYGPWLVVEMQDEMPHERR